MSNKMITIKGQEISEDTIVEALKKHISFKEKPSYQFQAGDVCITKNGNKRIICKTVEGKIVSFSMEGKWASIKQEDFEYWGYKKIGVISEFIKD